MFRDKLSEYCFFNDKIEKFSNIDIEQFENSDQIVYEVIRIIDGKPLFWQEHIDRIFLSFEKLAINLEISKDKFTEGAKEIISKDNILNNNIKIVIGKFSDHIKILIYNINSNYPSEDTIESGVKVKPFKYERRNPGAKIINLNYRKEVSKFISEEGLFEAILVDNNNHVTEGSRSNVFFIKNGQLYTPKASRVLLGITRMKLLELFDSLGLKVRELDIEVSDINTFDAAFLTGTSINALAVDSLGDKIYSSSDNETFELIRSKFEEMILEHTYW